MNATPNPDRNEVRRTLVRSVRFSWAEWQRVEERARECGTPPASFLRASALGAPPRTRPKAIRREAVYHLARIGNNLNQLAKKANATGRLELSRRLEETLRTVLETIQELSS